MNIYLYTSYKNENGKIKYNTYLVEDVIEYDSEYITKDRDYVSIPKDIKINQISGTNNLIAIKGFDHILTEEEFKT